MFAIKKIDRIIILVSVIGIIATFFLFYRPSDRNVLMIYANGQKKTYSLEDSDFTVNTEKGWVKVKIRDRQVRVIDSSCCDKWCINMGKIDNAGESIVCLPSRIFISIESISDENKNDFDAVTR